MGSVDLVPYWQEIVVTLETVIASIEPVGIIMQVLTQTSTISLILYGSTCLLRRRGAAVQRWETAAQAVTGAQYADYRITALGYDITGG